MRLIFLFLCLSSLSVQAAPRVVVSIAPLYEITASIMAGVAVPDLIVKRQVSTHHFSFRPSHMRLMQQADLVIWIDRHFESGFNRLPEILPRSAEPLELLPALASDYRDGHIWYSPRLIRKTTELIVKTLGQLDPANQTSYRKNADELITSVQNWRRNMQAQVEIQPAGFITDHAFLGHFVRDFNLDPILSAHDQHDAHGGLSDLGRIEAYIQENRIRCLITATPEPSKLALNLSDKYHMKIFNIVPLADPSEVDTISVGKGIIRRLEQLTNALAECRASS